MDNDNYFLTQEGNEEYSGICGDTPVSELMHAGIKGMKWGVRRYQNPDGSLTPAGKKRYNKTLEKVRAEEKALREKAKAEKNAEATRSKLDKLNARVDAVNKKKQALKDGKKISDDDKSKTEADKEAEKKAYEEAKAKAIKSGSATEVLKYKGDLTPQEMQSVTTRLQWEQNMQNVSAKEMAVGKSKVDKAFETLDKTTERAVTAAKAWNMTANIINAVAGLDVSLPKIDTNIGNGNKETRDKEKKAKKDAEPKEKSALDKLKEETAWIDAQNKNREAKRASRRHDEADAKEAAKREAAQKKQEEQKEKSSNTSKKDSNVEQTFKDLDDLTDTLLKQNNSTISNISATTQSRGESYVNSMLALPAPDDD